LRNRTLQESLANAKVSAG